MRYRVWCQITVDAAHRMPHQEHVGEHGHRYLIRVFMDGVYDPATKYVHPGGLESIRQELHGTVIDDMLPGVMTTPSGIAAWLLERYPSASAVEVRQDNETSEMIYR